MAKLKEMTGFRVGMIEVIRLDGKSSSGNPMWMCKCECGKYFRAEGPAIRAKRHLSCGCHRERVTKEMATRHGKSRSQEYIAWTAMKQRCYYEKSASYYKYGAKGITVCERWRESFENFIADMGPKPSPSHSIDRIDSSRGYSPDNCRWATCKEQNSNTRKNVYVYDGREQVTIAEYARRHGISPQTLYSKYKRGAIDHLKEPH